MANQLLPMPQGSVPLLQPESKKGDLNDMIKMLQALKDQKLQEQNRLYQEKMQQLKEQDLNNALLLRQEAMSRFMAEWDGAPEDITSKIQAWDKMGADPKVIDEWARQDYFDKYVVPQAESISISDLDKAQRWMPESAYQSLRGYKAEPIIRGAMSTIAQQIENNPFMSYVDLYQWLDENNMIDLLPDAEKMYKENMQSLQRTKTYRNTGKSSGGSGSGSGSGSGWDKITEAETNAVYSARAYFELAVKPESNLSKRDKETVSFVNNNLELLDPNEVEEFNKGLQYGLEMEAKPGLLASVKNIFSSSKKTDTRSKDFMDKVNNMAAIIKDRLEVINVFNGSDKEFDPGDIFGGK